MSEELTNLIKKRGSIKHKLTNFIKFIEPISIEFNGDKLINEDLLLDLQLRAERIPLILDEFECIQCEIELMCNDENLEMQFIERDEFTNKYNKYLAIANKILRKLNTDKKSVNSDAGLQGQMNNSCNESGANIKLPVIQLPKFKGSYDEFLYFKDTFESLIHNNVSINATQKFHYLKASLEGAPLQIIRALEFTAQNYAIAWELICNRYNNPRILIQNHIKALFNLPALVKENSYSLRNLIDSFSKHLRSLDSLGQPTEHWDSLLIFLITMKLDRNTSSEWEKCKGKLENLPTLNDLKTFLKNQADLLETLEINLKTRPNFKENNCQKSYFTENILKFSGNCNYCQKPGHKIYKCTEFSKLSSEQKLEKIVEKKLCKNCLCSGHELNNCRSNPCAICKEKHNRLLHPSKPVVQDVVLTNVSNSYVLLATIKVKILDIDGNEHICNAILDSASQSNFISRKLIQKLNLPQLPFNMSVSGINDISSKINKKCNITMKSLYNNYTSTLSCLILNKITNVLPSLTINISDWNIPENVNLADNEFNVPKEIDLLIGASHFWSIIKPGRLILGKNMPQLQNTVFGYTVVGQIQQTDMQANCLLVTQENSDLNDLVKKFWSIEECPDSQHMSKDDQDCENLFASTFKKDNNGRFIVRIPLKDDVNKLGDSQSLAIKRFSQLENKFDKNPLLKVDYKCFMKEYLELGHMQLSNFKDDYVSYFLPHHAVLREDSLTTKIRVVFNGSAPSSSGYSINDLQYTGPSIQTDLFKILINFRKYSFAVTADIEKMYRQILIHPDDRKFQKIVYRFDRSEELNAYELMTVTYGTASAPYLAIRCLQQLALENKDKYPEASNIIKNYFYVDDLIAGFDDESQAIRISSEISQILNSAHFPLRKWRSNSAHLLHTLANDDDTIRELNFGDKIIKTLGIQWCSNTDQFSFNIQNYKDVPVCTKRHLLSEISKIFDPLGLLSPCLIIAKIIIQKLWILKTNWDDKIPAELEIKWLQFRNELINLNKLSIPRHAILSNSNLLQLHGFCDSSIHAYGACIYLRSINTSCVTKIALLCSKTKVAPLKPTTMPRLELMAALLLSKLFKIIANLLECQFTSFLWSDSTTVLHWIHTEPHKLQPFVANRVHKIQELSCNCQWNYVKGKENPADLCSRGLFPNEIIENTLWWNGPAWLYSFNADEHDYKFYPSLKELPECKKEANVVFHTKIHTELNIFERFSSLQKLQHVLAYCFRFIVNSKSANKSVKLTGSLSVSELNKSLFFLVRLSQAESFSNEFKHIRTGNFKNLNVRLKHLTPFFDNDGIIRLRGRIKNSNLSFDSKHPILLDSNHSFTKLIFLHEHQRLMHAGPQLLLNSIRQKYWPIKGTYLAKKIFRNCLTCFKFKPLTCNNLMGDLPEKRVSISPPFSVTGIDYAGPFPLKDRKGRGCKITKGYICLFVCFSVKAVHIELASDLTTDNFIACLRRFSSRRGYPQEIWSDNGTNFVGASNMLNELNSFLSKNESHITDHCASNNVKWNFIPANSPHFGGLWESNIKSVKTHLSKVIGNSILTYEEFMTVLVQIECVLNSRPLHPMSNDPSDLNPITPAHFLISRPLTLPPDPNVLHLPLNKMSRYQLLQQLYQSFWKRWSRDYLSSLQHRYKWNRSENIFTIGTMVLVKNDNLPPSRWLLGRIVGVHPGSDGAVRVVSVKTSRGILKRAIVKVCVLPLSQRETND